MFAGNARDHRRDSSIQSFRNKQVSYVDQYVVLTVAVILRQEVLHVHAGSDLFVESQVKQHRLSVALVLSRLPWKHCAVQYQPFQLFSLGTAQYSTVQF